MIFRIRLGEYDRRELIRAIVENEECAHVLRGLLPRNQTAAPFAHRFEQNAKQMRRQLEDGYRETEFPE